MNIRKLIAVATVTLGLFSLACKTPDVHEPPAQGEHPHPQADPGGPSGRPGYLLLRVGHARTDAEFWWQHGTFTSDVFPLVFDPIVDIDVPDDGQFTSVSVRYRGKPKGQNPFIVCWVFDDGGQLLDWKQRGDGKLDGEIHCSSRGV